MEDNIKLGLEYTPIVWALVGVGVLVIIYLIYNMIKNPQDINISLRNVLRNKRRSMLTLSAVIFALVNIYLF
jgi:heme exporter protein D